MKKTYIKLMALTGTFGLLAFGASAQISGVVTINSANATAGTNYQSFTALATDLNTSGINGPLTVNVVANSGPYVEQPIFNAISGSGASNRITINGNNNVLSFNSSNSAAPQTLGLNGTDYMTINSLNVWAQGATYAMACVLTNGADQNRFTACTFSCPVNGTSSYQIPFSLSSSMTSPSGGSNSGNYNTATSCTMANGYYGLFNYGYTGAPYQQGNSFYNCRVTDFYIYGIYYPYQMYCTIKNCTVDRVTRTSSSTVYGFAGWYNQGAMIDGNKLHKLYASQPGATGAAYLFYTYYTSVQGGVRNTIRNNLVTEINTNGTIFGMYCYYGNSDIYNNTIDLDANVTQSGTIYGMYPYGSTGYNNIITNNLITIRRPGSGTRYGIYIALTGNIALDRNNVVHTPSVASSYYGYYTGAASTLAQWQTLNIDFSAMSIDPTYSNQPLGDLHPTNAAMNNTAVPLGVVFDQEGAVRDQNTPDIGALEFLSPSCVGTPSANSVTSPSYAICPGEDVTMGLATLTSALGYAYQWNVSTISNVGPFTPVGGATGLFLTAPSVTANTWYQCVQTCTLPGGGSISPVGAIVVAGPSSSVVPAYESFEGIGIPNRLPNCSWTATGLGGMNKTYTSSQSGNRVPRTGVSFGTFDNGSPGTSAYYSNPIAMSTGITYSAAVWYATEYFGYNNWTNLTILVGPNQSTTGLVQVASISPAISGPYAKLDGLFTVPSAGNYYVCIRATSTSGSAQFLSFDDLSITIPCTPLSGNASTLIPSSSTGTICAGQQLALNASGANTYTWSTGANGASTTDNPTQLGLVNYYVSGTNTLTGCVSTATILVQVDPSPNVFAVANPPVVCAGSNVIMTAFGANSFAWSNGSTGQNASVNPNATTSYTVIGTNAQGCSGQFVQNITVNALPVVGVVSSNPAEACKADLLTLTANGGVTYQWMSNTNASILQGNPVNITANATTVFTVMAIGANGCVGKATLTQSISDCTGLNKLSAVSGVRVYPNPTSGVLTVEFDSNVAKTVSVLDVTGRVIMTTTGSNNAVSVDLSSVAAGIYYVKLQSENAVNVVKVVKQ
jgi:hypothetical protein